MTRGYHDVARAFMDIGGADGGVRAVTAPKWSLPTFLFLRGQLETFVHETIWLAICYIPATVAIQREVLFNANRRFNTGELHRALMDRGILN